MPSEPTISLWLGRSLGIAIGWLIAISVVWWAYGKTWKLFIDIPTLAAVARFKRRKAKAEADVPPAAVPFTRDYSAKTPAEIRREAFREAVHAAEADWREAREDGDDHVIAFHHALDAIKVLYHRENDAISDAASPPGGVR